MMAESAKAPFDAPDWIFEIKLDGYRAITVFDSAGKPHLWSRNGLPLEAKFPAVATAVSKLKLPSTILDGEVATCDIRHFLDYKNVILKELPSGLELSISQLSESKLRRIWQ